MTPSLADAIDPLTSRTPEDADFSQFFDLAASLKTSFKNKQLKDDIGHEALRVIFNIFGVESYDAQLRRCVGSLLFELLKYSTAAVNHYLHLHRGTDDFKFILANVVLSKDEEPLKVLAGSMISQLQSEANIPPEDFWPDDAIKGHARDCFPKVPNSQWARPFEEFLESLHKHNLLNESDIDVYYPIALVHDDDVLHEQMLQYNLVLQVNGNNLTCARISFAATSCFIDMSLDTIEHWALQIDRRVEYSSQQGGPTVQQLLLEFHPSTSYRINGRLQPATTMTLVFEDVEDVKMLSDCLKKMDESHKNPCSQAIVVQSKQILTMSPHMNTELAATQTRKQIITNGSKPSQNADREASQSQVFQRISQPHKSLGEDSVDVVENLYTTKTKSAPAVIKSKQSQGSSPQASAQQPKKKLRDQMLVGDDEDDFQPFHASSAQKFQSIKKPTALEEKTMKTRIIESDTESDDTTAARADKGSKKATTSQAVVWNPKKATEDRNSEGSVMAELKELAVKSSHGATKSIKSTATIVLPLVDDDRQTQPAELPRRSTRQTRSTGASEPRFLPDTKITISGAAETRGRRATGKPAIVVDDDEQEIGMRPNAQSSGKLKSVNKCGRAANEPVIKSVISGEVDVEDEISDDTAPITTQRISSTKPAKKIAITRVTTPRAQIDNKTPKMPESPGFHESHLDVLSEKAIKKPNIVHFGETGPQNQGKTTLGPVDKINMDDTHGQYDRNPVDDHIEDEEQSFEQCLTQPHGSQISNRVSTDGSPFAKGTRLPLENDHLGRQRLARSTEVDDVSVVSQTIFSHHDNIVPPLEQSADLHKQQGHALPTLRSTQIQKLPVPPSRNPDNEIRRPALELSRELAEESPLVQKCLFQQLPPLTRGKIKPNKSAVIAAKIPENGGALKRSRTFLLGEQEQIPVVAENVERNVNYTDRSKKKEPGQVSGKEPDKGGQFKKPEIPARVKSAATRQIQSESLAKQALPPSETVKKRLSARYSLPNQNASSDATSASSYRTPSLPTPRPTLEKPQEVVRESTTEISNTFLGKKNLPHNGDPVSKHQVRFDVQSEVETVDPYRQQHARKPVMTERVDTSGRTALSAKGLSTIARSSSQYFAANPQIFIQKQSLQPTPYIHPLSDNIPIAVKRLEVSHKGGRLATAPVGHGQHHISNINVSPNLRLKTSEMRCEVLEESESRLEQKGLPKLKIVQTQPGEGSRNKLSRFAAIVPSPRLSRTGSFSPERLFAITEDDEHQVIRAPPKQPTPDAVEPQISEAIQGVGINNAGDEKVEGLPEAPAIAKGSKFQQLLAAQIGLSAVPRAFATTTDPDGDTMMEDEDSERTLVEIVEPDDADNYLDLTRKTGGRGRDSNMDSGDARDDDEDDRMSDHSSGPSDSTSDSSHSGDFDNETESDGSDEEDAQETALHDCLEWENGLAAHQKDFYTSFERITEQLLRHIIDTEESVNTVIKDYETGGIELIRTLETSQSEEAKDHEACRRALQAATRETLRGLVSETLVEDKAVKLFRREEQEFEVLRQRSYTAQVQRMDSLLKVWGYGA